MWRRLLLVTGFSLAVFPTLVWAQADSARSYDASALRVESRLGDLRIVRGVNGVVVGKIGTFGTVDLTKLVGPSENALKEAREFNRNHGSGNLATAVGGIALGVLIAVSSNNDPSWGLISAEVAASGLALYGGIRLNRAYNALARSIWWYNRDLKRN
jgi:hypothetical protein